MNNKNLLITFGCSWTYGVGVNYQPGMSRDSFRKNAWNQDLCDSLSFRGILSSELGLDNINFSHGGSSNQMQFRLAKEFFTSKHFLKLKNKYKNITVLWGITSTSRNELFNIETNKLENFFLTTKLIPIAKQLLKYSYNHDHEVAMLATDMKFWNSYFEKLDINNFWFDTFNHHDYVVQITQGNTIPKSHYDNLAGTDWPTWENFLRLDLKSVPLHIVKEIYRIKIFGDYLRIKNLSNTKLKRLIENSYPRDLASYQAIKHGWKPLHDNYHHSNWEIDSDRIKYLTDKGLLNPWSMHPTAECHKEIADFFKPYIKI